MKDKSTFHKLIGFCEYAPNENQVLNVILWYFFKPKRCQRFVDKMEAGMNWPSAYKDSKIKPKNK